MSLRAAAVSYVYQNRTTTPIGREQPLARRDVLSLVSLFVMVKGICVSDKFMLPSRQETTGSRI
jgi:hypothetical protein